MDRISSLTRSEIMSRIRCKNTAPETQSRRFVHALGFRYRLHENKLPGRPDMIFRKRKKLIFLHGCFWHQHNKCKDGRIPNSRQMYWRPKLLGNKARDERNRLRLTRLGWRSLVIWECDLTFPKEVQRKVQRFLERD